MATSPNTVLQMVFKKGSTNTKKKKLPIKFTGMASPADPKLDETQQPTNNDEAEDKDRQGTMRSRKVKDETKKVS
uniref:DUF4604 domain-containing protein n=2 Tax=Caenorhabditis tropicalis TaxID=1561998 RepID=A0A1I7SXX1_9PELO